MINYLNAESHIESWLNRMVSQGRVTRSPEAKETFTALYALYLRTVKGEHMGTTYFSLYMALNGHPSVNLTGNRTYKTGIKINPAS